MTRTDFVGLAIVLSVSGSGSAALGSAYNTTIRGVECVVVDVALADGRAEAAEYIVGELNVCVTGNIDPCFREYCLNLVRIESVAGGGEDSLRIVANYIVSSDGRVIVDFTGCQVVADGEVRVSAAFGAFQRNDGTIAVGLAMEKSAGCALHVGGRKPGVAAIEGAAERGGDDDQSGVSSSSGGLAISPNPGRAGISFSMARKAGGGSERLRIYDLRGRLVADEEMYGEVICRSVWDGKDRSGATVASGVYFAVVGREDNRPRDARKFTFVR